MSSEIKRELQGALDDLLRQRRLRAEARQALTLRVRNELRVRGMEEPESVVRAMVDARMGKEWDTNGRTLDYQWAQREVQTWGILAIYELLVEVRRDQVLAAKVRARSGN